MSLGGRACERSNAYRSLPLGMLMSLVLHKSTETALKSSSDPSSINEMAVRQNSEAMAAVRRDASIWFEIM